MQQEGLDIETAQNRDYFGALIHHLSLVRDKRCLLSYVYVYPKMLLSFKTIFQYGFEGFSAIYMYDFKVISDV